MAESGPAMAMRRVPAMARGVAPKTGEERYVAFLVESWWAMDEEVDG